MKIVSQLTLKDLGFKKKGKFPEEEANKIIEAIRKIKYRNFDDYKNNFEKDLALKLQDGYTDDSSKVQVFKDVKGGLKGSVPFKQAVDLYNEELRIAIEVEKTKETTLLFDVVKFIVGNKRQKGGRPIIEYGVLVIPDGYRNEKHPEVQGSRFRDRLKNELAFINTILFVKDILIVEYDTGVFFSKKK